MEKINVHLRSYSANPRNFLFPVARSNSDPDCHDERHPGELKLEPLEEVGRSSRLGKQPYKSRRCVLLTVETHQVPCVTANQQFAQQPIVEGVTGLVGAE